ncbi:MAG TPA: hypothetical protein QF874_01680 [Pelagibacteraceae bacterium]|jgi:hypothetical protein|nr:hypothetical protein [Pelagibacteraceae bacterium]|tara:strand:- start:4766 stop:5194 length:429 start_codon:yes stop_codon:yes gene_type:complete
MQKNLVILIFVIFSILFTKYSNAEIKIKYYYTCDSIKYPKYNFGFLLNRDKSAKVYKINQKKILHYKIQYSDYKTFMNLELKEFIGKNINLIEIDETNTIQFYGQTDGKYLGGCIKTKNEASMACKLINFDLVSRKKKPINC